mmetsp:Transcript_31782/g.71525  ORF Transcript_31782/g.71525 Transcript_31782/m.71525 type:complete len:333 (-) Transcript_31782:339-1337(-)
MFELGGSRAAPFGLRACPDRSRPGERDQTSRSSQGGLRTSDPRHRILIAPLNQRPSWPRRESSRCWSLLLSVRPQGKSLPGTRRLRAAGGPWSRARRRFGPSAHWAPAGRAGACSGRAAPPPCGTSPSESPAAAAAGACRRPSSWPSRWSRRTRPPMSLTPWGGPLGRGPRPRPRWRFPFNSLRSLPRPLGPSPGPLLGLSPSLPAPATPRCPPGPSAPPMAGPCRPCRRRCRCCRQDQSKAVAVATVVAATVAAKATREETKESARPSRCSWRRWQAWRATLPPSRAEQSSDTPRSVRRRPTARPGAGRLGHEAEAAGALSSKLRRLSRPL